MNNSHKPSCSVYLPPMKNATNVTTGGTGYSLAAALKNFDPFAYTQAELAEHKVPMHMAATVVEHFWVVK